MSKFLDFCLLLFVVWACTTTVLLVSSKLHQDTRAYIAECMTGSAEECK